VLKNKKRIVYGIAVTFLVVALTYTLPLLLAGHKQRKALEATFTHYSSALIQEDYPSAYSFGDAEFRAQLKPEDFASQQKSLVSKLGRMESAGIEGYDIHGQGSPMRWIGVIREIRRYEKGEVHILSEFHFEEGHWQLFGYKEVN